MIRRIALHSLKADHLQSVHLAAGGPAVNLGGNTELAWDSVNELIDWLRRVEALAMQAESAARERARQSECVLARAGLG